MSEDLEKLLADATPLPAAAPTAAAAPAVTSTLGPTRYDSLIENATATHGLPPNLLKALIKTESNFNPMAVSSAGARGLVQLMPGTAKDLGVSDPHSPGQAIDAGARYLRQQFDTFGSWDKALAAYNAGPGAVQKAGGIPNIPETQAYVPKILGLAGMQSGAQPAEDLEALLAEATPLNAPDAAPPDASSPWQPGEPETVEAEGQVFNVPGAPSSAPGPDNEQKAALLAFRAKEQKRSDYDPVRAAEILRYATAHPQLSVGHIAESWDGLHGYREQAENETHDWKALAHYHPELADYALQDPARLALVRDDSANLTSIADLIFGRWEVPSVEGDVLTPEQQARIDATGDAGKTILPPWAAGLRDATTRAWAALLGGLKTLTAAGPADEDQQRGLDAIARARESGRSVGEEYAALLSAKLPPSSFQAALDERIAKLKEETKPKDYGPFARTVLGRFVMGMAEMTPAVVGAVASTAVAGPAGGLAWWTMQNLGPLADEARALSGPNGEKLDPDQIRERTVLPSIVGSAAMELGVGGGVVSSLTGAAAKVTARDVGNMAAAKAMLSPTFADALGLSLGHLTKDTASGLLAMGIQNVANQEALEGMRAGVDPNYTPDPMAAAQRAVESLPESLYGLLPFAMMGAGSVLLRERGRTLAARADARQVQALGGLISSSEVFKNAPEEGAELIRRMKSQAGAPENEPVHTVYVDLPAFQRYWQEKKIDPRQAAAEIGVEQVYDDAVAHKNEHLEIPTEKVPKLVLAGNGEHWQALKPDIKLSATGETPRQSVERQRRDEAAVKERAALEPDQMEEGQRRVFVAFRDDAIATGKVDARTATANAKIFSAQTAVLASKTGRPNETAWELWQEHELRMHGDEGAAHVAAARAEYDESPHGKAWDFLRAGKTGAPAAPASEETLRAAAGEAGEWQRVSPEPAAPTPTPATDTAKGVEAPVAEAATPPPTDRTQDVAAPTLTSLLEREKARQNAARKHRILTPQRPEGEEVEYRWVPQASVVASHDPRTFQPNPEYREGVQERQYHSDFGEQQKVRTGAKDLNPDLLLSNNPTPGDGPPIVTEADLAKGEKHIVIGGNGREQMMELAFENDPALAEQYRQLAAERAQGFGIDPATVTGPGRLVRVLKGLRASAPTPELVAAGRRMNETLTQELSPRARAVAEAKTVSPGTIRAIGNLLSEHPDSTLRELMREQPEALIDILVRDGIITPQNQSRLLDGGSFTEEGKGRVEGLFLGRVIGSADRMDRAAPSILQKLERAAPGLLRVEGSNPKVNEIPTVQAALDLLRDAASHGMTVRDILSQQGLLGGPPVDAAVASMARLLEGGKQKEIRARFEAWADAAASDPRQVTMFAPPSHEELQRILFDDLPSERKTSLAQEGRVGDFQPKLDRDAVEAIVGPLLSDRFPTEPGGIHPDELAKAVGAESGEALLHDMLSGHDREASAQAVAADRVVRGQRLEQPSRLVPMGRVAVEVEKGPATAGAAGAHDAHADTPVAAKPGPSASVSDLVARDKAHDIDTVAIESSAPATNRGGAVSDARQDAQGTVEPGKSVTVRRLMTGAKWSDGTPWSPAVHLEQSQRVGPVWHSAVERAITGAKQSKGTADSWLAVLSKSPGVKAEEMDLLRIREWLDDVKAASEVKDPELREDELARQGIQQWRSFKGSITRQEIMRVAQERRVHLDEKILGEPPQDTSGTGEALRGRAVSEIEREGFALAPPGDAGSPQDFVRDGIHGTADEWSAHPRPPSRRARDAMDILGNLDDLADMGIVTVDGEPLHADLDLPRWIVADAIAKVKDRRVGSPGPKYLEQEARKHLEMELHVAKVNSGQIPPFSAERVPADGRMLQGGPAEDGWAAFDHRMLGSSPSMSGVYSTEAEAKSYAEERSKAYLDSVGASTRADYAERAKAVEEALPHLHEIAQQKVERWEPPRALPTQYEGYVVGGHVPGSERELLLSIPSARGYQSPHFGLHGRGLVVHARVTEHVAADGKRVLLIEEIQSDLHQAGREKGYQDSKPIWEVRPGRNGEFEVINRLTGNKLTDAGKAPMSFSKREHAEEMAGLRNDPNNLNHGDSRPPNVPWKEGWEDLALKRILHYAAEHGYDKVALTPGQVHAKRWGSELIAWEKGPRAWSAPELTVPWEEARTTLDATITATLEAMKDRTGFSADLKRNRLEHAREIAAATTEQEAADLLSQHGSGASFAEELRDFVSESPDLQGKGLEKLVRTKEVPGYRVTVKQQHRGEAGGMNLEDAGVARGLVKTGNPRLIASEADLKALIADQIGRDHWPEERAAKVAEKLWPRIQSEEAGAHMPRAEGFTQAYDKRIRGSLEKLLKKYGGKLGEGRLENAPTTGPDNYRTVFGEKPDVEAVRAGLDERLVEAKAAAEASGNDSILRDLDIARNEVAEASTVLDLYAAIKDRGGASTERSAFDNARLGLERLGVKWEGLLADGRQRVFMGDLPANASERITNEGMPLFQDEKVDVTLKLPLPGEGGKSKARGYFEFTPAEPGEPVKLDVHLLNADRSTLAHETFHTFSVILGQVATREDAPAALRAEYQKLLDLMGYASHEERTTSPVAAKEEKASHLWETYLAEGKAPTKELRSVFAQMKGWLSKVYEAVTGKGTAGDEIRRQYREVYGEDLQISDDVRKLFDRFLATDKAIEDARAEVEPKPPADLEAMTPAERAKWQKDDEDSKEASEADLLQLAAEDDKREAMVAARAESERIRGSVEKEIAESDPAYKALAFLQTGAIPGTEGIFDLLGLEDSKGEPFKLSRPRTVELIGAEATSAMPKGIFGKGKAGVSPDLLAEKLAFLGYDDGKALLEGIRGKDFPGAVKDEVTRRVEEKYGPALVDDPARLEGAAREAVRNEAAARKYSARLEAIARELDPSYQRRTRGMSLDARRELANNELLEKPNRSISPDKYAHLEKLANERATAMWEQGKKDKAWEAVDAALWNHVFADRAKALRDAVDKAGDEIKASANPAWRTALGKATSGEEPEGTLRGAYRDFHDTVLNALRIGPDRAKDGQRTGEAALDALLLQQMNDANPGVRQVEETDPTSGETRARLISDNFDDDQVRAFLRAPKPWHELTADEALNVHAAVKSTRAAANERNEFQLLDRKISRADLFAKMRETAETSLPEQPRAQWSRRLAPRFSDMRLAGQWMDAQLLSMETMIRHLDGRDDSGKVFHRGMDREGIFHQAIWDPFLRATETKRKLVETYLEPLQKAFEAMPKEIRDRRFEPVDWAPYGPLPADVVERGHFDPSGRLTRSDLWMVLLNMGSGGPRGNKVRLLEGYGWKEAKVWEGLRKNLSKPEFDWAQTIWDSLEGLYPMLADLHEKETGLRPEKVEAAPFSMTFADGTTGEYRGGYFPARYDPRAGKKLLGIKQEEAAVAQMFGESYRMVNVVTGHAKARAANYHDVVNLDWSTLPSHVGQVTHDLAFRSYVKQTAVMILQPEFQSILKAHLGEERALQFKPWLQVVANQQADSVAAGSARGNRILGALRGAAAIQAMGYNLKLPLLHISNPLVPMMHGMTSVGETLSAAALHASYLPQLVLNLAKQTVLDPRHLSIALAKQSTAWAESRRFALECSPALRERNTTLDHDLSRALGEMGGAEGQRNPVRKALRDFAFSMIATMDRVTATPIWLARYWQVKAELDGKGFAPDEAHEKAAIQADDVIRTVLPAHNLAEQPAIMRSKQGLGGMLLAYGYMSKMYQLRRGLVMHEAYLEFHDEDASAFDKGFTVAKVSGTLIAGALAHQVLGDYLAGRGPEPDEEWWKWTLRKNLTSDLGTAPLIGPGADIFLGKKVSLRQAPAIAVMQDAINNIGSLLMKDGEEPDKADAALKLAELLVGGMVGVPLNQFHKTGKYVRDVGKNEEQPRGPFDVGAGIIYGKERSDTRPGNPLTDAQDLFSGGSR